ncbi:hypothetical protein C7M84_007652 [Penaeus vannamei]|uniref:Uncharacterized protein n=1 Tax=Penaeus vannamei TaxID=6689 RepID=A0A3R7PJI2_PENVA|nr:hypothetical protein C7M84_007652 [Penaeus vannamei]
MKMVDNSSYTMVTRRPPPPSRNPVNPTDHHNNNFLAEVTTNTTNTTPVTSLPSLSHPLLAQNDNGHRISLGSLPPRPSPATGPSRSFQDNSSASSPRAALGVNGNLGGSVLGQQQMGSSAMPPGSHEWDEEVGCGAPGSTLTKSATQPSLSPAGPLRRSPASPTCQSEDGFSCSAATGGDAEATTTVCASPPATARTTCTGGRDREANVGSPQVSLALVRVERFLKYEPQNATAREFFPLISLKIKQMSDAANLECHSSTDEGHESDEDTMDSYSSLEDEIDDEPDLACSDPSLGQQKPFLQGNAALPTPRTRTTQDTIIRMSTPVQSSPESAMSGSNSLDFSYGIDSADSLFSSTESDLTLESVVNATRSINLGDS